MKNILVADDMPTILEQVREIAGDRYNVISVEVGEDIIKIAGEKKPDVILLDMYLDQTNSEELLKGLKADENTKGIPVIITASDASVMELSRYYKMGACDFMKKPFVENILFRRIDVACALKEAGRTDLI
ncbi:MAG: response regulator [Lachnospiraceae bacterium]|nr:response regulator [Lachnospiraceae bacterium]